nr:hypothetical protein [Mycoplasma sp. Ms02]
MKLNKLLLVVGASSVVTLATGLAANCAPAQEQPKNPETNKSVTPAKDASDNQNTAENTNADANNQNASENTNADSNNQNASDNTNADANNQNASENTNADANNQNASENTNTDANNQNASDNVEDNANKDNASENTEANKNAENQSENTNTDANNENSAENTNAESNNQNTSENAEEQPKEPAVEPARPATLREKAQRLVEEAERLLKEYPNGGDTALVYESLRKYVPEARKLKSVLLDESVSDEVIQPVFEKVSRLSREFHEALPALIARQRLASLGQILRALSGLSPYVDNPQAFYTSKLIELADEAVKSSRDEIIDTKEAAEELLSKYETRRELIASLADLQEVIKSGERIAEEVNDLEEGKADLKQAVDEASSFLTTEAQAVYPADFDYATKEREVREKIQSIQNKINLLRNVGGNNATGAIIPQVAISAREAVLEMVKLSRKLIERVELSNGSGGLVPTAAQEAISKLREYTDKHEKAALDFSYTNGGYRKALFNDAGVNASSYSESRMSARNPQESLLFWFVRVADETKNDVKVTWDDVQFLRSIIEQTVASLTARSAFYDTKSKDTSLSAEERQRFTSRRGVVDRHTAALQAILLRSQTNAQTSSLMTLRTLCVDFHKEFSGISIVVNPRTFLSSGGRLNEPGDQMYAYRVTNPTEWKAARIPSYLLGNIDTTKPETLENYKSLIQPIEEKIDALKAKVENVADAAKKKELSTLIESYYYQAGGYPTGTRAWTDNSVKYSIIKYEGQAQDFLKALERKEKEIDALLAAQPAAETQEEAPAQA